MSLPLLFASLAPLCGYFLPHHPIDRHAQMLNMPILYAERDARHAVESSRLGRRQELGEFRLRLSPFADFRIGFMGLNHELDPSEARGQNLE